LKRSLASGVVAPPDRGVAGEREVLVLGVGAARVVQVGDGARGRDPDEATPPLAEIRPISPFTANVR